MARKDRYVFVCTKRRADDHKKGSCAAHGSEELVSSLKLAAGKARLNVRVTSSGCFDLCWVGASVSIMPDNIFLKRVGMPDIPRLVDALGKSPPELAEALHDRIATDADFVDPTKASSTEPTG